MRNLLDLCIQPLVNKTWYEDQELKMAESKKVLGAAAMEAVEETGISTRSHSLVATLYIVQSEKSCF